MGLTKCTTDLNVIAGLPDAPMSPEYTAQSLKEEFDKAPNMLKEYINDTLIPEVETAISDVAAGESAVPYRKLVVSYTASGYNTFNTAAYPSENGYYDIVLVGGGGGGCLSSGGDYNGALGGGGGAVTELNAVALSGVYIFAVGAAGVSGESTGTQGGMTYFYKKGYSYEHYAKGGEGAVQSCKVSFAGGIGGTDSAAPDTANGFYGAGGDSKYGRGARGGAIADSTVAASGSGGGGWGDLAPTAGAVYIYAYCRD